MRAECTDGASARILPVGSDARGSVEEGAMSARWPAAFAASLLLATTTLGSAEEAAPQRAAPAGVATEEPSIIRGRAVEAAIWGMPIVSFDAMRQAFFRDAGAK